MHGHSPISIYFTLDAASPFDLCHVHHQLYAEPNQISGQFSIIAGLKQFEMRARPSICLSVSASMKRLSVCSSRGNEDGNMGNWQTSRKCRQPVSHCTPSVGRPAATVLYYHAQARILLLYLMKYARCL